MHKEIIHVIITTFLIYACKNNGDLMDKEKTTLDSNVKRIESLRASDNAIRLRPSYFFIHDTLEGNTRSEFYACENNPMIDSLAKFCEAESFDFYNENNTIFTNDYKYDSLLITFLDYDIHSKLYNQPFGKYIRKNHLKHIKAEYLYDRKNDYKKLFYYRISAPSKAPFLRE